MAKAIPQRKRLAMDEGIQKFKTGGSVMYLKSGRKDSPLETAKRRNGIPGFKAGGATCNCKGKHTCGM